MQNLFKRLLNQSDPSLARLSPSSLTQQKQLHNMDIMMKQCLRLILAP
jgi:hypothetical protein